jgi:hypothetical protein
LSQDLGWRTLHTEPEAGLKTGERPSPHEAEKYTSGRIIQLNLVRRHWPQVKSDGPDSSAQRGTLARDQHGDWSEVHLPGRVTASFG